MNSSAIFAAVMLTGLWVAAIYDVYLGYRGQATITDSMRDWSSRWPILPLSVGVVLGHIFWCSCPKP